MKIMRAKTDELTHHMSVIMTYFEASNESILGEVNKKVVLVNENTDYLVQDQSKNQNKKLKRTREAIDMSLRHYADEQLKKSNDDHRRYADDRRTAAMNQLRKEFNEKIHDEVYEKLQVPGLIGHKCPFPSLSNYLLKNNIKVEMELANLKH